MIIVFGELDSGYTHFYLRILKFFVSKNCFFIFFWGFFTLYLNIYVCLNIFECVNEIINFWTWTNKYLIQFEIFLFTATNCYHLKLNPNFRNSCVLDFSKWYLSRIQSIFISSIKPRLKISYNICTTFIIKFV